MADDDLTERRHYRHGADWGAMEAAAWICSDLQTRLIALDDAARALKDVTDDELREAVRAMPPGLNFQPEYAADIAGRIREAQEPGD